MPYNLVMLCLEFGEGFKMEVFDGHRIKDYEYVKKVQAGFYEMLNGYEWKYYFTGNFNAEMAGTMTAQRACKFVYDKFIKELYPVEPIRMSYFYVIEDYKFGGIHWHGIVTEIKKNMDFGKIKDLWQSKNKIRAHKNLDLIGKTSGYLKAANIDDIGGLPGYLSKYITKSYSDYRIRLWSENKITADKPH